MISKWYQLLFNIIRYFLKFEFIRFGIVGFFNTVIDYTIMNVLMFTFKVSQGVPFVMIKIFSIVMAVIFSYYVNLIWTFKAKDNKPQWLFQFVILNFITISINVLIASYLVDYVRLPINQYLWANIASLIGAIVAIIMRYFGSRIIFNKK
jgi:putative flippase GtrA